MTDNTFNPRDEVIRTEEGDGGTVEGEKYTVLDMVPSLSSRNGPLAMGVRLVEFGVKTTFDPNNFELSTR